MLIYCLLLGGVLGDWDPNEVAKIKALAMEWEFPAADIKNKETAPANHVPGANVGGVNDGVLSLMVSLHCSLVDGQFALLCLQIINGWGDLISRVASLFFFCSLCYVALDPHPESDG
jgi:hypothetical protein